MLRSLVGGSARWTLPWRVTTTSYSTNPQPQSLEVVHFRTSESNPANHDESHLGRFYTIDQKTFKKIFGKTGLYKGFMENCEIWGECPMLIRKPFLDIKRCIEAYDEAYPTMRYVLFGPLGCGKNMTLGHLAHYGHSKDYILVNIPWAKLWTRYTREYLPSVSRPGYIDHTENSVIWLSYFRSQNSELIKKLDLKTEFDHEWSQHEVTKKGESLLEIIEHGISRPPHAADCLYALILELKALSTLGKCKTMVLINGVNAFYYNHYRIQRQDKSIVPYDKITVFQAFKESFKSDWKGGVVAVSTDVRALHRLDSLDPPEVKHSYFPRDLLRRAGWEDLDPFIPIHVPPYSSVEAQTTIDYYLDRKWLQHPLADSKEGRMELEYLSYKNPFQLMKICNAR